MTAQKVRRTILFFSFLLFPIIYNYMSPILLVAGTAEKVIPASLIFWGAFFITSLFIGRAACAYICPFASVQTIKFRLSDYRLKKIKGLKTIKYVLGAAWVGIYVYVLIIAGGYDKFDFFYLTEKYVSIDRVMGLYIYYALIGVPLLLAYLFGKMGFCHYFCPFSILNIVGTKVKKLLKIPSLNLVADKAKCKECGRCDASCPMSLPVSQNIKTGNLNNLDCTLCGECCAVCKSQVIKREFTRGKV